jgi:uncharacterized protein (TIGR01627 family)
MWGQDAAPKKPRARLQSVPSVPEDFDPVRLLSLAPPIILSGMSHRTPLRIPSMFARRFGNMKSGFIMFPSWSIEQRRLPEAIRQEFADHAARYPSHRFLLIGNAPGEMPLLEDLGLPALCLSKDVMVSDRIFRPALNSSVEFDAVCNARFVPVTCPELAAEVPRVGYLAYVDKDRQREFYDSYRAATARNPGHVLLNDLADGLPTPMTHEQVNTALGRAAVGLILSEVDGASGASMEYLLAGLPVVSTSPSGNRDVFLDPDFCIVCGPDPAAVRDAVTALRARNIPREVIRSRTLAKLQPERARFLAVVEGLIEELVGERRDSGGARPFGDRSGIPWHRFNAHFAELADWLRAELGSELGFGPAALTNVQLDAAELRPIIDAIRRRPGCRLLVFGCGNDSPFWEKINRGGTTVFLEDDPRWVAAAKTALTTATVHAVQYGTTLAEWRRLLDRPSKLAMELPGEVRSRRWDVILVDGPAGFALHTPGRMKSIYAASQLVAPGGHVFVHDSQRPVERTFASRYLGDSRLFIEARKLKGYSF